LSIFYYIDEKALSKVGTKVKMALAGMLGLPQVYYAILANPTR
jgi:hypothetical protein